MAKQRKPRRPNRKRGARQQRILDEINRRLAARGQETFKFREREVQPLSAYQRALKEQGRERTLNIARLGREYDLTRKERGSLYGLQMRLDNVMKLAQSDEKIRQIMEHRWKTSDAFEEFGYVDFTNLSKDDMFKLAELYVARGGIMHLPSLETPKGTSGNQWDS